ncbi:MAG TPA: hypothetical protein VGS12_18920 [Caulobacteraceae bacterium]|nr:hypothetical protein [Caulobacteraceae bacterium]
MKRIICLGFAAAALAASTPALAQDLYGRAGAIEDRIDAAQNDGSLSFGEARMLRARLRGIERTQRYYDVDGMRPWQARDLDRRFDRLSDTVSELSGY